MNLFLIYGTGTGYIYGIYSTNGKALAVAQAGQEVYEWDPTTQTDMPAGDVNVGMYLNATTGKVQHDPLPTDATNLAEANAIHDRAATMLELGLHGLPFWASVDATDGTTGDTPPAAEDAKVSNTRWWAINWIGYVEQLRTAAHASGATSAQILAYLTNAKLELAEANLGVDFWYRAHTSAWDGYRSAVWTTAASGAGGVQVQATFAHTTAAAQYLAFLQRAKPLLKLGRA